MHIIAVKPLKGGNNNSKEVTICITCKFPVRLVVLKMGFGEYPPEFNPRIHGPYHPGRYYGKADLPLSQVKLGELGSWFSRRSYTPQAMTACTMRAYWRWSTKYLLSKRTSIAPLVQFAGAMALAYYFLQYRSHANHRHAKYH